MANQSTDPSAQICNPELLSYSELHIEVKGEASSRKDPRQRKTDAALEGALLTLLGQKTLDQITVLEICAAAGIHKTTFFRRHASKDALLDHIAADQIESLVRLTIPVGDNFEGFRALCDYVEKHRSLWKALLTGGAGGAMREELLRVSRELAMANGGPSWLPLDLVTTWTVTIIVETLAWWLSQSPTAFSIDEVAKILHRGVQALRGE